MFTRLCLISLLILFTQRSFSCVCTKKWSYENYDYIALVEVIELRKSIVLEVLSDLYVADPDRPFPPPPHLRPFFEVVVETKTQYKGIEKKIILVSGNSDYFTISLGCDLPIHEGDQWLIFGYFYYFNSEIMTDYCTSSVRHQNGYGERDYQYNSSLKAIKKLDLLFPKQPIKEKQGLYLEFYPDGRPRLSERYEHGRLNGERKAYYSNGQLMLLECYAKGIREEECIWWYRNGKMKKECYYRKGQLVDKIVHYSEKNGKPRVIHYYSPEGDFLRTEKFNE